MNDIETKRLARKKPQEESSFLTSRRFHLFKRTGSGPKSGRDSTENPIKTNVLLTCGCQGGPGAGEEGRTGSLGLADAN